MLIYPIYNWPPLRQRPRKRKSPFGIVSKIFILIQHQFLDPSIFLKGLLVKGKNLAHTVLLKAAECVTVPELTLNHNVQSLGECGILNSTLEIRRGDTIDWRLLSGDLGDPKKDSKLVKTILEYLDAQECRAIAITGVSGVGKVNFPRYWHAFNPHSILMRFSSLKTVKGFLWYCPSKICTILWMVGETVWHWQFQSSMHGNSRSKNDETLSTKKAWKWMI